MALISEAEWESTALEVLAEQGWAPSTGTDINHERASASDIVLHDRFTTALVRLNPQVPELYLRQAATEILTPSSQDAITENRRLHEFLVHGYRGVTYLDNDNVEQNPTIQLVGREPGDNDWLAVRQVTISDAEHHRRFDVVGYLNGLPVLIAELKQAGVEGATLATAHGQLATYLAEFPLAFRACVLTVISDGVTAGYGTPFTPLHHYAAWNVDDDGEPLALGEVIEDTDYDTALEVTFNGLGNQVRFLDLMRHFTAFDAGDFGLAKRIAKPHQYFAVNKALGRTVTAVKSDGRAGVVWHTQGSGKSMEMELYANLVLRSVHLLNPTIVVITDRRELDGQLYRTFAASTLLPQMPVQIATRSQLREELTQRSSGGILFTTLQKFNLTMEERESGADHPLLSDRRNIVVVVDEAHRSHYDDLDGYARFLRDALPHATLIAFTGTPISEVDRDTREVFGDYIDIYDLSRAVADGATVPVFFEPRLVKVAFADDVTAEDLDRAADEATVGLDDVDRERLEKSVAVINAVYGAPARLATLAADVVGHWETRRERMRPLIDGPGKAMIVCATRQICADLYEQLVALRPDWHSDALDRGVLKVVYSGTASDPAGIRKHVRRESENQVVKQRLKDPDDQLELVIVKDMMLTGYDSPPLHTLYLDRPMKGALLMQTLARVNRTFRGKDAGLLVAYAPLAENLTAALAEYTVTDQEVRPVGRPAAEAVELARALLDQLRALVAGYDWRAVLGGPKGWVKAAVGLTAWLRNPQNPGNQVSSSPVIPGGSPSPVIPGPSSSPVIPGSTPDLSVAARYRQLAGQLGRAWALAAGYDTLADVRDEVRFYEEVRVWMAKFDAAEREARGEPVPEEVARLLRQLAYEATGSDEVVDIYAAAEIAPPDFNQLTPAVLTQAQKSANPHLAIEALRDAILAEAARSAGASLVRQRAFSERLSDVMLRYTNSQLTAAEVLIELFEMARDVAAEAKRGEQFHPPLGRDELATYDAIADNASALDVLGQDVLADIARQLVTMMRADVKTDWTVRDDVRASLRAKIRRLLRKYKYPPDAAEGAVKQVIEQMELLAPGVGA
ncbi:MAG: type I restriction endonuclease subunit R [Propionicimonas sp.]|uniref:type I restriction endonuclease subunit R n=1 Tax=Propionicimonas sp. TaxID=1955623 RepID=UPI003D0CF760